MLVPMLINLFYTTYSSSRALESEASSSLSRIALEKKKQVDFVFDSQFQISNSMVNELFMRDFFQEVAKTNKIDRLKLNEISENLQQRLINSNGLYENIFFSYDNKVLVDGVGGESVGHVFDKKSEAYYYEQLKNPGISTSDYMYSPTTKRPIIAVANSILDDATKKVLSVLVIAVDINKLTRELVKGSSGQNVNTMITDPQGLVIASSKAGQALHINFSTQDGIKDFYSKMKKHKSGEGYFTLNGVKNIASYVKHEKYGFYILSYMPVEHYMEKVDELKFGIVKVILLSVAITIIVVLLVVLSIVRPIKLVSKTAQQIARGDLTAEPINIKNNDEIGELAKSFNTMLVNLRDMVAQLNVTSEKVAATAEEFSATAEQSSKISSQVAEAIQQVATGADDQFRSASHISSMAREVTEGVGQVSENTKKVAAFAAQTTEKANTGAKIIYSSISEIGAMNENIHHVAEKIKHLGERSKEIEKIIEVITQISEQTNLLALNAAIEAARAGEHGRGFAVVSDEVRKLAEQTKMSSDQIKELINVILEETEETVHLMDNTVKQSVKGIKAVESVEQTFNEIQDSINEVTGQIQEVSSATKQMSAAIEQVSSNINQITRVATEIASQSQQVSAATEEQLASSEEMAASSASMAKMAEELQELIKKFKI